MSNINYFFVKSGLEFVKSEVTQTILNFNVYFKTSSTFPFRIYRKLKGFRGTISINGYIVDGNLNLDEAKKIFKSANCDSVPNVIRLNCNSATYTLIFDGIEPNSKLDNINVDFVREIFLGNGTYNGEKN